MGVAHGAYEHKHTCMDGCIWAWVYEVGFIRDTNLYACVQWVEWHGSKLVWKDIHDWVVNQTFIHHYPNHRALVHNKWNKPRVVRFLSVMVS